MNVGFVAVIPIDMAASASATRRRRIQSRMSCNVIGEMIRRFALGAAIADVGSANVIGSRSRRGFTGNSANVTILDATEAMGWSVRVQSTVNAIAVNASARRVGADRFVTAPRRLRLARIRRRARFVQVMDNVFAEDVDAMREAARMRTKMTIQADIANSV